MESKDFLGARRQAQEKRKVIENVTSEKLEKFSEIDKDLFKYFFDLQVKIEKEKASQGKGMDYHTYAVRMWEELLGNIDEKNHETFKQFENTLILNLHNIDMTNHIYLETTGNLATLIERYGEKIKNVILWSTGDVESTGYQIAKIESSGIIMSYYQALKSKLQKDKAKEIFRNKTSYMVDDNKFNRLDEYVKTELEKNEGEIKLVVIEDSRNNFGKINKALEAFGESGKRVKLIPIWATYSREGQQTRIEANKEGTTEEFEKQKKQLNAIDNFADLLEEKRFKEILNGAHVFVDFDGVISNNVTMRESQAVATYGALMNAAKLYKQKNEKELIDLMKSRITESK